MAYSKQTWKDLPDQTTPINAERLNHMETGIYNNSTGLEDKIIDEYSTSTEKGYSCNYANENFITNIEFETPTKTGRRFKINNVWKDEYIYYKNIGALPNNTTAPYTTNINKSSITMVTGTGGVAYRSTDGAMIVMNGARPRDNSASIACQVTWSSGNKFQFYIETGQDRSNAIGYCWVTYY